jgi:hypothetical protein
MDNYATHKTPLIRRWLAKRPRWHVHLTPTSSSWLNQVERFFALLTDKKIRRGVYRSVAALRADITSFIDRHNADPKPFRWSKSADDILALPESLVGSSWRLRRLHFPTTPATAPASIATADRRSQAVNRFSRLIWILAFCDHPSDRRRAYRCRRAAAASLALLKTDS